MNFKKMIQSVKVEECKSHVLIRTLSYFQSGKDKYTKLYIFGKPTISGIHYMKMKSSEVLKLMILIFVFILTYLFYHRSILFYQKRSHLIQGIMW